MTDETAEIIHDLLLELATELDLHYEQEDLFALAPTLERMRRAGNALEQAGRPVPGSYQHLLVRFLRTQN